MLRRREGRARSCSKVRLTVVSRPLRVSRACVAACFLLLLPGLAAPAVAQILPPRRQGLPSGPFLLFPSVSFEASHDSNVLYRSSDLSEGVVGSDIVFIRPRIMVELPIGRNRLRWAYSPQYRDYSSDQFQQSKRISHFFDFEANHIGILVTPFDVVHRHRKAKVFRILRGHRSEQICRECCNAAFARQIVSQKRDFPNIRWLWHKSALRSRHPLGPMTFARARAG